jgi:hypothetical protein
MIDEQPGLAESVQVLQMVNVCQAVLDDNYFEENGMDNCIL